MQRRVDLPDFVEARSGIGVARREPHLALERVGIADRFQFDAVGLFPDVQGVLKGADGRQVFHFAADQNLRKTVGNQRADMVCGELLLFRHQREDVGADFAVVCTVKRSGAAPRGGSIDTELRLLSGAVECAPARQGARRKAFDFGSDPGRDFESAAVVQIAKQHVGTLALHLRLRSGLVRQGEDGKARIAALRSAAREADGVRFGCGFARSRCGHVDGVDVLSDVGDAGFGRQRLDRVFDSAAATFSRARGPAAALGRELHTPFRGGQAGQR